MITGISIENFKGISERVTLDLRPITLLFGANSAGKSTILHALHYAREIFERHNLDADQTIAGGQFIDLGGFQQLQHQSLRQVTQHSAKPVVLRFELDMRQETLPSFEANLGWVSHWVNVPFETIIGSLTSATVEISIAWSYEEDCPFVNKTIISLDDEVFATIEAASNLRGVAVTGINESHHSLMTLRDADSDVDAKNGLFGFQSVLEEILGHCRDVALAPNGQMALAGRGDALPNLDEPLKYLQQWDFELSGDLDEDKIEHAKLDLSDELAKILSELILGPCQLVRNGLKQFRYLGPLRETPARTFRPPRFPDPSRWSSGLGAWDSLQNGPVELVDAVGKWLGDESHLNAGCTLERRSYLELDAADPIVRKLLNRQAFDDVEEGEGLDLSKVPMKSRIVILSGNSDAELRPHDVGIGISQVVPVIVTALDGEDRLLAIEQPELHIHPRLQAAIADLFIESIHKNKHRFIIETHSEHLILRLLRRIRETEKGTAPADRQLRTNELGIYYLKQENGSTTASRIDVDVNGEFIQPWPDDFFEIDFFERFPDAR